MGREEKPTTSVFQVLNDRRKEIATVWMDNILFLAKKDASSALTVNMLKSEAAELLGAVLQFLEVAGYDVSSSQFSSVAALAARISANHARAGLTPNETATFVLSFKEALIPAMVEAFGDDPRRLARELAGINRLVDHLSLETFAAFLATREETIVRQSRSILELSTADTAGLVADHSDAARGGHRHHASAAGHGGSAQRDRAGTGAGGDSRRDGSAGHRHPASRCT